MFFSTFKLGSVTFLSKREDSIPYVPIHIPDKIIKGKRRKPVIFLGMAAGQIPSFNIIVGGRTFPAVFDSGGQGTMLILTRDDGKRIGLSVQDTKNKPLNLPVRIEGLREFTLPTIVDPWGQSRNSETSLGQPEDIANLVSFLAGPDGGWLNGQILRANDGFA